ncbi:MAG: glycosyltransferase [Deltaproteobacteria bacterium]|nr:glycosyltransferase [Deltaproteobacteria bacterium]
MKFLEIGPYPPPNSGWSVRIKFLKTAFISKGHDCRVLNLGKYRKIKSSEYIDVQNGLDYLLKLILFRLKGYHFHIHMNAQAVKGPILSLAALIISLLTFERAAITLHGGVKQLYFPRENGQKMYWVIYLNFLFAKLIICNNEPIKSEIVRYGLLLNKHKIFPIQAFSVQYLDCSEAELPEKITNYLKFKKNIIFCYMVLRNGFYIETLIDFLERLDSDVGVILTGIREVEDDDVSEYYQKILVLKEKKIILTVGNLDHDQFMTLLGKSDIFLRTPVSDGVASSVLEALALKVPVVASENGRRPQSVITYQADNAEELGSKVKDVLINQDEFRKKIIKPDVKDTVIDEIELLIKRYSFHK